MSSTSLLSTFHRLELSHAATLIVRNARQGILAVHPGRRGEDGFSLSFIFSWSYKYWQFILRVKDVRNWLIIIIIPMKFEIKMYSNGVKENIQYHVMSCSRLFNGQKYIIFLNKSDLTQTPYVTVSRKFGLSHLVEEWSSLLPGVCCPQDGRHYFPVSCSFPSLCSIPVPMSPFKDMWLFLFSHKS